MRFVGPVPFNKVLTGLRSQGSKADWARQPIDAAERQFHCWGEYILDRADILAVRLLDSAEFGHELGITVGEYLKRLEEGSVRRLRDVQPRPGEEPVSLAAGEFYPDPSSPSDIEGYRRLHETNNDRRLVCLDGAHRLRKWALAGCQEATAYIAGVPLQFR